MNPIELFEGQLSESNLLGNKYKDIQPGFSDKLKKAVSEANRLQIVADESIEEVVKGNMGIHEGMLAIQEASISLRLLLQVRGKVMAAYQEIMRMPV